MNEAAVELRAVDARVVGRRRAVERILGASRWRLALGTLGLAVGYAALRGGARSLLDWNVSPLLVGCAALLYWLTARDDDRAPSLDPLVAWLVMLAPAYVALQLVTLPLSVVQILSPGRAHLLDVLGAVMPDPRGSSLSINAGATMAELVDVLACAVVFLLVRDIAWRSRRNSPWFVVLPLIIIAGVEAAIGLAQAAAGAGTRGTYQRVSHFAGLVEMALPIAVACGVAIVQGRRNRRRPSISPSIAGFATLIAAALLCGALVASGSRIGLVAAACGLLAMGVLTLATVVERRAKLAILGGIAGALLVLLGGLPADRLLGAFSVAGNAATRHWPVWRDTLRLIGEYPLTGSGPGTYASAVQNVQTAGLPHVYGFAQNDYLQLVAEMGLLGAPIFLALMAIAYRRAARAATTATDWHARLLGLGCTGAITAIAVHSLVDFNTHIPANALTLAWIAGLAVSAGARPGDQREPPIGTWFRGGLIALACALVLLASARLGLATTFKDNPDLERKLCRFRVCDTDALVAVSTRERAGTPAAAVPVFLEALWRDPADPSRWCDLGEAMLKAGRVDEARTSFTQALALGPHLAPIHERVARFHFARGETREALGLASRALQETNVDGSHVLELYIQQNVPVASVLADGLPAGPPAPRQYLRALMGADRSDDASVVWSWLMSHRYASDADAREFVHYLFSRRDYEQAARAWAQYVDDRGTGYLQSTWIFDGGFESRPSGAEFDWKISSPGGHVDASIDPAVARSGSQSLRVRFDGSANVDYHDTTQVVFITPGVYRFTAFIRAMDVTSDQGVAFHIVDSSDARQVDLWTPPVSGRVSWTRVEQTVTVPPGVSLLTVEVARRKSQTLDSQIAGTVWIDDVSLIKIE